MQDTEYTKEESSIIAQGQKVRFGARHVQFIFIFGCLTLSIAMRASFSIAIVAMTDNKTTQNHDVPTYSWNNTSVMLSSFFWSYIIFQVFAGYVAKKYGPKYLLLSGSIVNALSFSLIPVSAKYASSDGVIAMRVIQGLAQGSLFPCAHTVLGTWSPTEERSLMGMIVYSEKVRIGQQENKAELVNGIYTGNKGPLFGARHVQILLLSYCVLIGIATRGSFAVQIVAMTAQNSSSSNPDIPTYYDWKNSNIILSSFYWLYVVSNLVAAPLEKKFGPKWFFLGAIFLNCLAYTLLPAIAALFGEFGALACRLLQGLGEGFMFPTQQVILGQWAPAEERSRSIIAINTGSTIGSMLSSIIPGYLSTTWWGWPSSFYVIGAMGMLWCVLFLVFGRNSPASHPKITAEEKRYIQMSLNQEHTTEVPIPLKQMATSVPVLCNEVAQIGIAWSNNMALTEYASYLDKVMNFDIKSNGLYSAIPPGMALIAGLIFGPASDYAIMHNYLSTVNSRRLFHLIGGTGISISIVSLSFLDQSQKYMAILLMVCIYVSQSAMACGNVTNMIDLSPRFAGIIFGSSNAVGQSIGLFAPILVQLIVTHESDITQWRIVFIITAGIIMGTSIVFVIFASGDRQPWDGPADPNEPYSVRQKKISVISMT
ncbi:hypothetical protein HUJ05_009848 [Dendroctonus ponderosae]|nr:hypothetical protein HUJ05_009848 [Dendroctonus ponderosae]